MCCFTIGLSSTNYKKKIIKQVEETYRFCSPMRFCCCCQWPYNLYIVYSTGNFSFWFIFTIKKIIVKNSWLCTIGTNTTDFFTFFFFGVISCDAQGLPLVLHSEITLGQVRGDQCGSGNWAWVGCVQGICPIHCTVIPIQDFFTSNQHAFQLFTWWLNLGL